MKFMTKLGLGLSLLCQLMFSTAQAQANVTIKDYNDALPFWGTSWKEGPNSVNAYYPSFYTGFAVRSEFPERIHIRLSRGNQTRLTEILDDQTLTDYLFDLAKRDDFYNQVTDHNSLVNIASEKGARMLPQLNFFRQILRSPAYGVLDFVSAAKAGTKSPEATYVKALETLSALNPNRVFNLHLDLRTAFLRWKTQMKETVKSAGGSSSFFAGQPEQVIVALDSLLWGRVNYNQNPSREVLSKLVVATDLALSDANETQFLTAALDLFKTATGTKYAFRVVNSTGQWESALQCANVNHCFLNYSEFTAIYPTGSVEESTTDQFGNHINSFATPGLWVFLSRSGGRDVDEIREEPYYAWIPKMDYEGIGNGFHNPGIRFYEPGKGVKAALGIPESHSTLEAVKRGPVSHGCSRLAMGHIWEMRHIFPVENSKMTQVNYFGSKPQDFDLFDIKGDGHLQIMGVEYLISYSAKGTDDVGRREGTGMEINKDRKLEFYRKLYGENHVFTVDNDNRFIFSNPSVSMPSYLDLRQKTVKARLTIAGEYPLYEQHYERDKVQFYVPATTADLLTQGANFLSKRITRLMGRIRGCAPTSDKNKCGEAAFENEAQQILREVH